MICQSFSFDQVIDTGYYELTTKITQQVLRLYK